MRWLARRLDVDRPTGLYLTVGFGAGLVFLAGFLSIAEDLLDPATLVMDSAVYGALAAVASPAVARAMWMATLLGDTPVMFAQSCAAVALLLMWGRPRRAAVLTALMVLGPLLAMVLKGIFGRPRPPVSIALVATPGSASFPSGHSIGAIVLYGTLATLLILSDRTLREKALGAVAGTLVTLAVGLSRVYLGVHWASDVLGSLLLGAALICVGTAVLTAWERFGRPLPERHLSGHMVIVRRALTAAVLLVPLAALAIESARNPLL